MAITTEPTLKFTLQAPFVSRAWYQPPRSIITELDVDKLEAAYMERKTNLTIKAFVDEPVLGITNIPSVPHLSNPELFNSNNGNSLLNVVVGSNSLAQLHSLYDGVYSTLTASSDGLNQHAQAGSMEDDEGNDDVTIEDEDMEDEDGEEVTVDDMDILMDIINEEDEDEQIEDPRDTILITSD